MEFAEVVKDVKNIRFESLRKDSEDSFEAVVTSDELTHLSESLEKLFGIPIWPSKDKISLSVQKLINDFGGIRADQTLYFWSREKDAIFAMLWPWQDGEHVTIKIVHLQQEISKTMFSSFNLVSGRIFYSIGKYKIFYLNLRLICYANQNGWDCENRL